MSVAEINVDALQAEALMTSKPEHILMTYWKRLRRHRLATASLIILSLIIAFVVIGPMVMTRMTYYNVSRGEESPTPATPRTWPRATPPPRPTTHWAPTSWVGMCCTG
jgi:hypothetical protein